MNLIEIWHYHRPKLAKIYLDTLNAGLVTTTTIFAPRRAGKTSFLLKDLTPEAEKLGYIVVYVDLWQTKFSPGLAIVRALEEAFDPKNSFQNIVTKLSTPIKKLKGRADIFGTKLEGEVELSDAKNHTQKEIALQIDVLIGVLCKKKPVLLLIDEAQELAKTKEHEAVATALRTSITKNQNRLRVVFTGSSRTQLAHVFSNSNAPLYSTGSAIADFPKLGRDFVEYIADKFKAATGRTLPIDDAWKAFMSFKQQPEPFLIGIVDMVLNPSVTLNEAMQAIASKQALTENHEGVWVALDAVQKALVKMLANDPSLKPFSKGCILKLRSVIGVESLEVTHVQRAMTKLSNIVFKSARDIYEFENEAFAQWVKTFAE